MEKKLTEQEQKEQDKLGHEQIQSYIRWVRFGENES